LAELIQAGDNACKLHSEIHILINSIWNMEKFQKKWKESIMVPIYKKGNKTDHSNYRGIPLSPTTYKVSTNILSSMLTPYIVKIIGNYQCGF
jgi:hypothetical protein